MDNLIHFNGFLFNSENGELIRTDAAGKQVISRLQPQPAKLLKLLLDNHPDIVTREQIQEAIWPDVQVDFDGSMHFCIRQIRAALEDQASDPIYIETIPRRGYRWIAEMKDFTKFAQNNNEKPPENQIAVANKNSPEKNKIENRKFRLISFLGLSIITILTFFYYLKKNEINGMLITSEKLRIAIMPFQPNDENNPFAGNDIAFQLVETLTNPYKEHFDIIGPTTTSTVDPQNVIDFAKEYQIDYLINGRFLNQEKGNRMLGELIRTKDGAHVWVQSFAATEGNDYILMEIKTGVTEFLLKK
jgi:DNA-binding winged helix-turn-helix (wHTH) protein/TolB-like protein